MIGAVANGAVRNPGCGPAPRRVPLSPRLGAADQPARDLTASSVVPRLRWDRSRQLQTNVDLIDTDTSEVFDTIMLSNEWYD